MKIAVSFFISLWIVVAGATTTQSTVILDVRTPAEFAEGHVKGARNLDFGSPEFKAEVAKLDRNVTYKTYCQKGGRASKSMTMMKELGFKNVESLGGIQDAAKKLHTDVVKD